MKRNRWISLMLFLVLLFSGCVQQEPGVIPEEPIPAGTNIGQPDPVQVRMEKRCEEIVSSYADLYVNAERAEPESRWERPALSQYSIDAIETRLMNTGYDVIDTNGTYPSYLTTADRFYAFWEAAGQGEAAEQEVIAVMQSGNLFYRLFTCGEVGNCFYSMIFCPDGSEAPQYERREIQDWALTERGNFYYRIYPAEDKHYADYTLIRMIAPDTKLYDMTLRYILPVNYVATNLFLTDWTESDFGQLSFNDTFQFFYYLRHNEQFNPDGYACLSDRCGYEIPASEFEETVMPYFQIGLADFRELAHYDPEGDFYPWRQLDTNDFVKLWYYFIEPEVTALTANSDGTVTLTVEVLSTDLKSDCLFAHEVTIRPLENGSFQYLGNRVTYQTEYGLPFCEPRLTWDEIG